MSPELALVATLAAVWTVGAYLAGFGEGMRAGQRQRDAEWQTPLS